MKEKTPMTEKQQLEICVAINEYIRFSGATQTQLADIAAVSNQTIGRAVNDFSISSEAALSLATGLSRLGTPIAKGVAKVLLTIVLPQWAALMGDDVLSLDDLDSNHDGEIDRADVLTNESDMIELYAGVVRDVNEAITAKAIASDQVQRLNVDIERLGHSLRVCGEQVRRLEAMQTRRVKARPFTNQSSSLTATG